MREVPIVSVYKCGRKSPLYLYINVEGSHHCVYRLVGVPHCVSGDMREEEPIVYLDMRGCPHYVSVNIWEEVPILSVDNVGGSPYCVYIDMREVPILPVDMREEVPIVSV